MTWRPLILRLQKPCLFVNTHPIHVCFVFVYIFVGFGLMDIKLLLNIWLRFKIESCFVVFSIALCSFKPMMWHPILVRSLKTCFWKYESDSCTFLSFIVWWISNFWLMKSCFVVFPLALCSFEMMTSRMLLVCSLQTCFWKYECDSFTFCFFLSNGYQTSDSWNLALLCFR